MNSVEAIREHGQGEGAILLRASQDAENGVCRITVTDNGGGFDADMAPLLFERGFSTRTSKSGGLGLHWCANTVKAMSGELTLESPGKGLGARATIILPLWQEQPAAIAGAA